MTTDAENFVKRPENIAVMLIGCIVIAIAIVGNAAVVAAVKKNRSLRTTTNILLANVAVADIISSSFLPLLVLQQVTSYPMGTWSDLLCKFVMDYHVPTTASTASFLTLTVVSVERYHAVVKPMRHGIRLREDTVKYAILVVWFVSIVSTLPLYIYGYYVGNDKAGRCKHKYPSANFYHINTLPFSVLVVLLPLSVNIFCYFRILRELYFKKKVATQNKALDEDNNRSKRKLVKVSLSITILHTTFLLPIGVIAILNYMELVSSKVFKISAGIFFFKNAINPFVCTFQSSNFRNTFKEMIKRSKP